MVGTGRRKERTRVFHAGKHTREKANCPKESHVNGSFSKDSEAEADLQVPLDKRKIDVFACPMMPGPRVLQGLEKPGLRWKGVWAIRPAQ